MIPLSFFFVALACFFFVLVFAYFLLVELHLSLRADSHGVPSPKSLEVNMCNAPPSTMTQRNHSYNP